MGKRRKIDKNWANFGHLQANGSVFGIGRPITPDGQLQQIRAKRSKSTFYTNNQAGDPVRVTPGIYRECNDSRQCASNFACIGGQCVPNNQKPLRDAPQPAPEPYYDPDTGWQFPDPSGCKPPKPDDELPEDECNKTAPGSCVTGQCGEGAEPDPIEPPDKCCGKETVLRLNEETGEVEETCGPNPDPDPDPDPDTPPGPGDPDDPNRLCNSDADCPSGVCRDGRCVVPNPKPECDQDNPCECGLRCRNGECVKSDDCESDADCCDGEECEGGNCKKKCDDDDDCPTGTACTGVSSSGNGSTCVPLCSSDADCPTGYECINGNCVRKRCTGPSGNSPCPPGRFCNEGKQCIEDPDDPDPDAPPNLCEKFCDRYKKANGTTREGCGNKTCDECEVCQSEPGTNGRQTCQKIQEAYDLREVPCYCDSTELPRCKVCNPQTGDIEDSCSGCTKTCTVTEYECPCGEIVGPITVSVPATVACGGGNVDPCKEAIERLKERCRSKDVCCDTSNKRGCNSHKDCGRSSILISEDETTATYEIIDYKCCDGRNCGRAGSCYSTGKQIITFEKGTGNQVS